MSILILNTLIRGSIFWWLWQRARSWCGNSGIWNYLLDCEEFTESRMGI